MGRMQSTLQTDILIKVTAKFLEIRLNCETCNI